EGDRLGVYPMSAAHHDRRAVADRELRCGLPQPLQVLQDDIGAVAQLDGEGRVGDIRAGQANVQVAGLRLADGLADHRQERYEVVAGTGLDLLDTLSVEARCPDTRKGLRRDSADGTPGFGGEYLDLQPELEAMAVGPDLADPRRCVTLDQVGAELLE